MVRNHENKITRRIRKNQQTRRKRVLKMKTKIRNNCMYKTMKGGAYTRLNTMRNTLMLTGNIGSKINYDLNEIARVLARESIAGSEVIKNYNEASKGENIIFVPDIHLGKIPDTIQFLIDIIKEQYKELCKKNKCGPNQPLLGLLDFNRELDDLCIGKIHEKKRWRWVAATLVNDKKYISLRDSIIQLNKVVNPPTAPTYVGRLEHIMKENKPKIPSFDITNNTDKVLENVWNTYALLHSLLGDELLDKKRIVCNACIIVMPRFKHNPATGYITYGYNGFNGEPVFTWDALTPTEQLLPNSYCPKRFSRRTIKHPLKYTLSPLVVTSDLLPKPLPFFDTYGPFNFQLVHDSAIKAMLETSNSFDSEQFKTKFSENNQVNIGRPYNPDRSASYVYYEFKIQKKFIEIGTKQVEVVIIEFETFAEDGLCNSKLILVSYKRTEPMGEQCTLPGCVPSTDSTQINTSDVSDQINELFRTMLVNLNRSVSQNPPINQDVLQFKDDLSVNRPIEILPSGDSYDGVCTIVLTRDQGQYTLSVAKATTIQSSAFNTVNDHISSSQSDWNNATGQKEFQVDNRLSGTQQIKVTIKIKHVNDVNNVKELISAEYRSETAVTPYKLFKNKQFALEHIQQSMDILVS